jgi:type 1 glutamine amidotransferase
MQRRLLIVAVCIVATCLLLKPLTSREVRPEDAERIAAAVPRTTTAKSSKRHKILVLSYQSHDAGRFAGEKALEIMSERTGAFSLEFVRSSDELPDAVMPDNLRKFDAVCVNNSTGGGGNAANGKTLVENLDEYVVNGGNLIGIHSATDNRFGAIFGGFFSGHPWSGKVAVKVDDPEHPLCAAFDGRGFWTHDEIYQFNKGVYTREKLRVLLSLDMNQVKKQGSRSDNDNAIAWIKEHGKGRVFYCSLGHNPLAFQDPKIVRFLLDGIQYALGDLQADATPSAQLDPQPNPALAPKDGGE